MGLGALAFCAMAFALIVVKEGAENPIIVVAAGMLGLATFGGAYLLDLLTSPRE